jgi:hypothetical protein
MSYDVSVGSHYSSNYTYNVSQFFSDHIVDTGAGYGLRSLDGRTGKDAFYVLRDAFERIERTYLTAWRSGVQGAPDFCAKYDPPNGWGSTVGATIFLSNLMAACAAHPRAKVHVS